MNGDYIELGGMQIDCVIGCAPFERVKTQRVVVDLKIYFDAKPSAATDDLSLAVDYAIFDKIVTSILVEGKFKLIETAAEKIAQAVLADRKVQSVEVRVKKPEMFIAGANPVITIRRSNS